MDATGLAAPAIGSTHPFGQQEIFVPVAHLHDHFAVGMHALNLAGITLDRKVLADIAMHEAEAFSAIIAQAKAALEKKAA